MTVTTRVVLGDGVGLACRDHGGDGPGLVLLHGAGLDQGSLAPLVKELAPQLRVVTFDLRGHGASPMAPWTMDTAVRDVAAVIDALDLGAPAVAGHSLGGMVAAEYGRRHPDTAAVINIDGHGLGSPEQYVDKDPARVAEWIREKNESLAKMVDGKAMRALRVALRVLGRKPVHPDAMRAIAVVVDQLDLPAVYREVACPLLVFNAHAPETGLAARAMKDPDDFLGAYRAGLRRDLGALAATHPNVELAEVDATHMLVRTHPKLTAEIMLSFLRRTARVG